MKFNYFLFFYLISHFFSLAQDDKIIFDSYPLGEKIIIHYDFDYNLVNKESADIYRELILKHKNTPLSKISEFSIDGTKIKTFYSSYIGSSNGRDSIILNGPQTLFHKNGYYSLIQYFKNNVQDAEEIRFFENGKIFIECNYLEGKKNGQEIEFYENGNVKSTRNYSDGKIEGEELVYYHDGSLNYKRNYFNNIPFGEEIGYYGTGEILYTRTYLDSSYSEIGYMKNGCKEYEKLKEEAVDNFKQINFYECSDKIESEFSFKNDLIHGKYTGYYFNGNKKYTINYVNGLRDGLFRSFYSDGKLRQTVKYINDEKIGEEKGFYRNGKQKFTRTYTNGLLNGIELNFDRNGKKISKKNWIDNLIIGPYESFYQNGLLKSSTTYNSSGVKYGVYYEYFPSGNMSVKGRYIDGIKQDEVFYYYDTPKNEIKKKSNLKKNIKHGPEIVYFSNGQINSESNFQNGKLRGEYAVYDEFSGDIIYSVNYIDNLKFGEEIEYYSNCLPKKITNYENNIKNGQQIEYHDSTGQIKSVSYFTNNIRSGLKTEYYDTGEIYYKVNYEDNSRRGQEIGYYRSGERLYVKNYYSELPDGFRDKIPEATIDETWYYITGEKKKEINKQKLNLVASHKNYYKNGKIESVFEFDGLNPIAEIGYYETEIDSLLHGEKLFERKYVDGLIQGEEITYHKSGEIKSTVIYEAGKKQGLQVYYNEYDGYEDYSILWENDIKKERRIALVIGNANYEEGDELLNPVNDARLMKESLEKLGFKVYYHYNLTSRDSMNAAINEFGLKREDYDVAFIYYAGHGVQLDNKNYLLPTKEEFNNEFDVQDKAIPMQNILRFLESGRNDQLNFIVLDACRNNPFEKKWNRRTRNLGSSSGLAPMEPLTGSLIAYSTTAGQVAADGDDGNSLYTQVLASRMLEKDVAIKQVFQNVRNDVIELSNEKGFYQRPIEESLLTGGVYYLNKSSE